MHDKQALQMLNRCEEEIISLRRRIEALEPKAEAYELIRQLLGLVPCNNTQGYGEDVLWIIRSERKKLEELIANPAGEGE